VRAKKLTQIERKTEKVSHVKRQIIYQPVSLLSLRNLHSLFLVPSTLLSKLNSKERKQRRKEQTKTEVLTERENRKKVQRELSFA
jgi:hypothetical protein